MVTRMTRRDMAASFAIVITVMLVTCKKGKETLAYDRMHFFMKSPLLMGPHNKGWTDMGGLSPDKLLRAAVNQVHPRILSG